MTTHLLDLLLDGGEGGALMVGPGAGHGMQALVNRQQRGFTKKLD